MKKLILLVGFFIFLTQQSFAESDIPASKNSDTGFNIITDAHFGFALQQQSKTFQGAAGSLLFLDVLTPVSETVQFGLRTTAAGGKDGGNSFYRMGLGPSMAWQINEKWSFMTAATVFKETAEQESEDDIYRSRGIETIVSWHRNYSITPRTSISLGAFLSYYNGDLKLAASAPVGFSGIKSNEGLAKGCEISLKTDI